MTFYKGEMVKGEKNKILAQSCCFARIDAHLLLVLGTWMW